MANQGIDHATSRAWVFTWNNPPPNAYDLLSAHRAKIHVINVGREVGASGTPHLQGHLVLRSPCRLSWLTRTFPGVHFAIRRGTESQAREYTEKEGLPDRLDWDDRAQGQRSDLQAMAALVAAHPVSATRRVAAEMPEMFLKFHGGVSALSRALMPPTPLIVQRNVRWHYGPTGTGKTHTALQEATAAAGNDSDVFVWSVANLKFAGTYSGQEYVVLDELRTTWEHFTFSSLLALLGNSRHEVEVKGGTVPWRALHIWVTAPVEPRNFACVVGDPVEQLLRRIATTRYFDVPYVAPAEAPAVPPPGTPPATQPLLPSTQPAYPDSDASVDLLPAPQRSPAFMVRSGARAPLPMCLDLTGEEDEDEDVLAEDYFRDARRSL